MSSSVVTAEEIQSVAVLSIEDSPISLTQTRHRFDLIAKWNIPRGARVLELGCGQGDCTAVLAHIVGPSGHVTAVDPGPINTYGAPYTLAQAQQHLSKSALGSRITWVEADPIEFLKSHPDSKYDFAVLAHCIWYFTSPTTLEDTFRALAPHVANIAVAEWSLTASSSAAMPHILAVFAQASLYPHLPSSSANIKSILSPSAIKASAARSGLTLFTEEFLIPTTGLQDGSWEVATVKATTFLEETKEHVDSEKERAVIYALRDSALETANVLKSREEKVQCMDVWIGVFASNAGSKCT